MVFRPDWEAVIAPVLDYAETRAEFAKDRIALFGYSLGAFLVARAAAFDHRPAAIILDDGMYDFFASNSALMPPFLVKWIKAANDDAFIPVAQMLMKRNTSIRWGFRNGVWTFGAESVADYLRKTADYTLDGIAHRIACPTLILEAEGDQFAKGQAGKVNEALKCPHKYVMLHKSEGAEEHCHVGAMRIAQQTMFDWLDETLG